MTRAETEPTPPAPRSRGPDLRVLFVDDEPAELRGLESKLASQRPRWDMRFLANADAAIDAMRIEPADVIVADLRMPGMDGGQLLDHVRERYPSTVRILLSHPASAPESTAVLPVAHQLLPKHCEAQLLERAIESSCGPLGRRDEPRVAQTLALLQNLPALPRLYWDLVRELDRESASSQSVAAIVEQDLAMTARILQMANSAFFSSGRNLRSVRDAVTSLGLHAIRAAVLQQHLFRAMSPLCSPRGFSLDRLQARSMHTAWLTGQMLADVEQRKNAYSAAMLHDIGYMVLSVGMPEAAARIRNRARGSDRALYEFELDELGCDHATIGARMLALWGLPVALVEAVAYHDTPSRSRSERFDAVAAVHVASVLACDAKDPHAPPARLDLGYLQGIGVADIVDGWSRGEPMRRI